MCLSRTSDAHIEMETRRITREIQVVMDVYMQMRNKFRILTQRTLRAMGYVIVTSSVDGLDIMSSHKRSPIDFLKLDNHGRYMPVLERLCVLRRSVAVLTYISHLAHPPYR